MKNKFLKNCLALFVITLVAGISLAFVNEVTKEPIAKAQDKARLEAYEVVYPNAEFKVMDNSDEILKASSKSLEKERNLLYEQGRTDCWYGRGERGFQSGCRESLERIPIPGRESVVRGR